MSDREKKYRLFLIRYYRDLTRPQSAARRSDLALKIWERTLETISHLSSPQKEETFVLSALAIENETMRKAA